MVESIALTGVTGELGSRVSRLLEQRGVPQRLVARDPERVPRVENCSVVRASYSDATALREAFRGVDTVLFVSAHEEPDRLWLHRTLIDAAAEAGVRRMVYTSFMGAAPHATFPFAREHSATEQAVMASGMRLTALRNSMYADVVPHFVGADGVIRGPAGDGRAAWVARRDVARLAAQVLLDDDHADRIYDVSGPEPLDLRETARLLGEVTGREITYRAEDEQEARDSRAGARQWQIDAWVGSYLAIATGETSVTSHTVEQVTGVRPWSFAEFLRAEPDSWRHLLA
ncbi:nucleoside-diphosphate sugar epimerase [Actinopolyspora erythraea]|uniref:Nucleoside-diphosphate sugar epimerase n=1 Tax=Actinopolyspora erythraea TaxID=414996 RepID=A0ABR4X3Y4_9ACTN|nr:SDR family oxidoreductase [Actinopolyspora erythraea]KGI81376.1 nucleoside-diphosphate sugar epimerase [Actinopolyspora erythraea]